MGAPSEVAPKQLRELHIRLNLPDKAAEQLTARVEASIRNCASARSGSVFSAGKSCIAGDLAARRELDDQRLPGVSTKRASASATAAVASGLVAAAFARAGLDALDDGLPCGVAADILRAGILRRPRDRRRRCRAT